jgi:homoserine O-acetyltransferase
VTSCEWLVAAVDSDRLYLPRESDVLAAALPGDVRRHTLTSPSGHDGFLIEAPQLGKLLVETVLPER